MSCVYGPRQFGTEDQGWVAHFVRRVLGGQPVTIYGTGKQVRDLLFVDDLVDALLLAQRHMPKLSGRAFNIGGGPANAASLLEILKLIEELSGLEPAAQFADWRPGDQPWYVSDIQAFSSATGWNPRVGPREGVSRLIRWLCEWSGHDMPKPYAEEVALCASR
jgi:CDP-paratose 2-epimerase